jgi:hypothetical protein
MRARWTFFPFVATAFFAVALFALVGAASSATTKTSCSKKPLCASITAQDESSRSPAASPHYFSDTAEVKYDTTNGATSNLVNINVVITWKDVGTLGTTATYVPSASDPDCVPDPNGVPAKLVCATPKSLRAGDPVVSYGPLVFKTSTNELVAPETALASATTVTVTATAKEQVTGKGGSPNEAVAKVDGTTSYEGSDDRDLSLAGDDGTSELGVTLATLDRGGQISKLSVPGAADRGIYEVIEKSYGGQDGGTCPSGLTCFGQQVTTIATGLSPVNLQSTYTGRLPSGVTEDSIVVVHDRTSNLPPDPVTIDATCSGVLFSGVAPPSTEIPCRRVKLTRLPGGIARVEIDAWDLTNGDWRFG